MEPVYPGVDFDINWGGGRQPVKISKLQALKNLLEECPRRHDPSKKMSRIRQMKHYWKHFFGVWRHIHVDHAIFGGHTTSFTVCATKDMILRMKVEEQWVRPTSRQNIYDSYGKNK